MKRFLYALVASGAVMLGAGPVDASTPVSLPDAATGAGCSNDLATPSSDQGATSCKVLGAAAQLSLLPAVQMTATSSSGGLDTVNAGAGVLYYFEFVGPSGTQIPIIIDTSLSTAITGNAGASSSIIINTDPSDQVSPSFNASVTACQNNTSPFACEGDPGVFEGAIHLTAISDVQGQIDLFIRTGGALGGLAAASADPKIMIDPSFSGASNFSLVLSTGVGNALTSVPEPASWALMLVGVGSLGTLLRARRRAALAPSGSG
jgi:hypothetical protein